MLHRENNTEASPPSPVSPQSSEYLTQNDLERRNDNINPLMY